MVKGCGTTRVYMCTYTFMNTCTSPRPRARLWYGTMQRLQVLDSRESTNEHKTCQQPWEDGRVSTELLVRPVFTLYRGSRCGSQGARPLTRQTVLHESTSVNSTAVTHQEKMQTSTMCTSFFNSHSYLVIVRNSNNVKRYIFIFLVSTYPIIITHSSISM